MRKEQRQGGCLCFSARCIVLSTGCFSVVLSLVVILPSVFVLVRSQAWDLIEQGVRGWLQENHGDKKVNEAIKMCFEWVNTHYQGVLVGIIVAAIFHLLFSLFLILGAMLYKRLLFIPWMITDMIILIFMILIFVCWTFLSFFVGLLVAILFPFIAGVLLGLKISLWRQVKLMFIVFGQTDRDLVALRKKQAEYKPLAGPEYGTEQYTGRKHLISISESSDLTQYQYKV